MPDHHVRLDAGDANELAELLAFLGDWLGSQDSATLQASLARFMSTDAYDLANLQADLARFTFLLGDNGERLFGPDQQ
jgi:hypothetical protein